MASLNRDVSSDKDGANALDKIFDEGEIRTRFEIAGTFLDNRAKETAAAELALKEEMKKPDSERDYGKIDALVKDIENNETWGMGGTGRLVLTALTGAVGGNVMGSTGSMAQAAAVNVLQGLGAQQVKQLADSLDSETARTALHAVLACGGAAAKGADCGSAAMGAGASVVLNNLIESLDGKAAAGLTETERDARANLVSSLITGIAAGAGLDASTAGTAAKIETENNAVGAAVRVGISGAKIGSRLYKLYRLKGVLDKADLMTALGDEAHLLTSEIENLLLNEGLSREAQAAIIIDLAIGAEAYDMVFGTDMAARRDAVVAEKGGNVLNIERPEPPPVVTGGLKNPTNTTNKGAKELSYTSDTTRSEYEDYLRGQGFKEPDPDPNKDPNKDKDKNILKLVKDDIEIILRDNAKSTGKPAADIRVNGNTVSKIRLSGP